MAYLLFGAVLLEYTAVFPTGIKTGSYGEVGILIAGKNKKCLIVDVNIDDNYGRNKVCFGILRSSLS